MDAQSSNRIEDARSRRSIPPIVPAQRVAQIPRTNQKFRPPSNITTTPPPGGTS
jgi:hypothetical protein